VSVADIATPQGLARVHVHAVDRPRGALVLGHGAGGSVGAPDLVAAAGVAREAGLTVALVEQPYRVAGRRSAAPAPKLDEAWRAVLAHLRDGALAGLPVITGGRSSGARVACRTAADVGAAGVLCLAFPLHPPGRPEKTRLDELEPVAVPVLIVQGERDPFGRPPAAPGREVVVIRGDHGLKSDVNALRTAIRTWLPRVLPPH
jgi:predicted alpha/beta-hydrolase family hydrolase